MSIRITGQRDLASVNDARPVASKSTEADSKPASSVAGQDSSDHAEISTASQLVALAKSLAPAGREEKLATLAARVSSGTYKPAAGEVSRSIVKGLISKNN